MNLFLQCKNFSLEISLEEIKNMQPEDAYYLEAEMSRLIEEERLTQPIIRKN